jgi:hypothetical protein
MRGRRPRRECRFAAKLRSASAWPAQLARESGLVRGRIATSVECWTGLACVVLTARPVCSFFGARERVRAVAPNAWMAGLDLEVVCEDARELDVRLDRLAMETSVRCLLWLEVPSFSRFRWTACRHRIRTPRARKDPSPRGHSRTTRALPGSFARAGSSRRPFPRARDPRLSRVRGPRTWLFACSLRCVRTRSTRRVLV